MFPELIGHLVCIAGSVSISPWAAAFNQTQRLAIEADPTYAEERPYGGIGGLKAARAMALLSYRNAGTYNSTQRDPDPQRTGRPKACAYQDHQGDKLAKRFDAYSYHALTRLMDTHNVVRDRGSLAGALGRIRARVLAVGISTDLLFPVAEQKLLAHITQGTYTEIHSGYGHDGFLIETGMLTKAIGSFLAKGQKQPRRPAGTLEVEWSRSA